MIEPFYSPKWKPPPPRAPRPGELLFEFVRKADHVHFRCELRFHGEHGFEVQFFHDCELSIARTFQTNALAVQWAEEEWKAVT